MPVVFNPAPKYLSRLLYGEAVNRALGFRPRSEIAIRNPGVWKPRRKTAPYSAVFTMGLTSGRGKKQKWTPDHVRRSIMKYFPKGGSIAIQLGWWEGSPEESIKVILENTNTGLTDVEFTASVKKMLSDFTDKYRQQTIYLDFFRGTRRVGTPGQVAWVK